MMDQSQESLPESNENQNPLKSGVDMRIYKNRFFRLLVLYYGALQIVHFCTVAAAGVMIRRSGEMGFPAAPPPEGWSIQVQPFLIGTGLIDAVNAGIALLFVYAFLRQKPWSTWLGASTLTIMLYSAVIFIAVTAPSGAWSAHPVSYLIIGLVFAPVIPLSFLYYRELIRIGKIAP